MTRTTPRATSVAIRVDRIRPPCRVSVFPRLPAFRAAIGSVREVCHAGNAPKSIVVRAHIPMAKQSTAPSVAISPALGRWGAREIANAVIHWERIKPAIVPPRAMRKLSISECRMRSRREAPRAARTANSRVRWVERTRLRFATLTQAINSTRPIESRRSSNPWCASPTTTLCNSWRSTRVLRTLKAA